nr:hypothetical protein [Tanacetum cinerariifolium]
AGLLGGSGNGDDPEANASISAWVEAAMGV